MLKTHKKQLIISSILILLPAVIGALLWNVLPDNLATHWGTNGEANGWSSKGVSVFGLPLFILVLHWFCVLVTSFDRKNEQQTRKITNLILWICPVVSWIGGFSIYGTALGVKLDMTTLPFIFVGILFLAIGNYLPKCKHNYTIGIKLPWTLSSEENWNATHRFAGKVWAIGGILFFLMVFLPTQFHFIMMIALMLILVLIPTVYSCLYAKKHP